MTKLSLILPEANKPDKTEDPKVTTALTTIQNQINGELDGSNVIAGLTGLRLIRQSSGIVGQKSAAATLMFQLSPTNLGLNQLAASVGTYAETAIPDLFYINAADYAITGKANTQFKIKLNAYTNAVTPAASFTAGLYKATAVAGASQTLKVTFGAVIASSEAKVTTPAKETLSTIESSAFTLSETGHYNIGVVLSAETAANSYQALSAQLYVLNS